MRKATASSLRLRGGAPASGSGLPQSADRSYLLSGSRQCTSFSRAPFRVDMRAGAVGLFGDSCRFPSEEKT